MLAVLPLLVFPLRVLAEDFGVFEVSGLRCVIGNNAAAEPHCAGCNGVFSIATPDEETSPFVPLYASGRGR